MLLERTINYMRRPGVWFATAKEIAEHWKSR